MPRRMVLCARPVAALTAVIPPRPSETASTAAQRRRPRSVNSSARPWYLVSIHRTIRWSIMREIVTNSPHRSQCRVRAINYARRLTGAAQWVGARLDDPNGVLALAAFSSIFKFAGIAVFYPWLDPFARLIVRISGEGSASAVGRLEPIVARAGGVVALEASWRAILEVAHSAVEA